MYGSIHMMTISYIEQPIPHDTHAALLHLAHPDRSSDWQRAVFTAFSHSDYVVSAWDTDTLIGTARVIHDGVAFALLADVLVHPDHRHKGIGRTLVTMCRRTFPTMYMYADPANDDARTFYTALGFTAHQGMVALPSSSSRVEEAA